MGLVALFSTGAAGCSALVDGAVEDAWIARTEDGTDEAKSVHADQGIVYCVASVVNGSSKKTLEMTIEKIADPPLADLGDAEAPPAGRASVASGVVVATSGRVSAPIGTRVPYSIAYGVLDDRGQPDPEYPLATGKYRCHVQLSDDDDAEVEFTVECPAGPLVGGTACGSDRAVCPSRGASQPASPKCTCLAGVWSC